MIRLEPCGSGGLITLDRVERRNALDIEHLAELRRAVEQAQAEEMRVLTITGAGTSFCSGADLGGLHGETFRDALYGALRTIRSVPIPVLAAVNGPAIGAGTQLAIACDLRVSVPDAIFSVPTAKIGLAVDPWTIRRLSQLGGGGVAAGIMLGSDQLSGERAHRVGLVNRLGDASEALAWAEEIGQLAPLTLAYSKRVLDQLAVDDASRGLTDAFIACWESQDFQEGQLAQRERRPPSFRGI